MTKLIFALAAILTLAWAWFLVSTAYYGIKSIVLALA